MQVQFSADFAGPSVEVHAGTRYHRTFRREEQPFALGGHGLSAEQEWAVLAGTGYFVRSGGEGGQDGIDI